MQKIEYRRGDLFSTDSQYILHGCNCQGVMGSGVAKTIKEKYPLAFEEYKLIYDKFNCLQLGTTIFVKQPGGKTIINALTQLNYGRNGVHVSYWAIANIFKDLNTLVEERSEISMPMIGAGLGGGNWNVISSIIENECITYQPIVYQL